MYLEPPEIYLRARLNRVFCSSSSADFVWEPKLPSTYKFLVDKVLGEKMAPEKRTLSNQKELFISVSTDNTLTTLPERLRFTPTRSVRKEIPPFP
ncbi:unnamed protein product [Linum trigynum]|uniref:Uncharacterized protein n=1 Tax=Linum trigynum TaxID=586398 RepID=A0AAV2FS44_9ROSI